MDSTLTIAILAGGAGTRLWPMSTLEKPKQFQHLVSNKTMLQETLDRVRFAGLENIVIASNAEYKTWIKEQTPEIPESQWIMEPCLRDTAPAIGLIAAEVARKDPKGVVAIVYADHLVRDQAEFEQKLKAGAAYVAETGRIAVIEVKATEPNTNLGYVKIGRLLEERGETEFYELLAFKEKPDLETAKRFVASYQYLWNTGYYIFRVDQLLELYKAHQPKTYEALMAIQNGQSPAEHYPLCEKISFDYGIMEKMDLKDVRIIPASLGWNDIGTWKSLFDELSPDPEENLLRGDIKAQDCHGCLAYNEGDTDLKLLGLTDVIVVQTKDHTLICSKEASHKLKEIL